MHGKSGAKIKRNEEYCKESEREEKERNGKRIKIPFSLCANGWMHFVVVMCYIDVFNMPSTFSIVYNSLLSSPKP